MRINLLERERYFKVEQIIFLVVAALFLLFWHQILSHEDGELKGQIYNLQQTLEVLKDKDRVGLEGQGQVALQKLKDLVENRNRLVNVFAGINHNAKRSLTLAQIAVDRQGVKVKGVTAVIADLTCFVAGLASKQGKEVVIEKVGRQDDLYGFLISW